MPHDLPPWQAVSFSFRRWRDDGTWEGIHSAIRERARRQLGREATPSAAIVDGRSVKTTRGGGPRGHDGHENAGGRERHLSVATQGFPPTVVVAAADVRDRDGGRLLAHAPRPFGPAPPRRALVWADAAYAGARVEEPREPRGWTPEVVKRSEGPPKRPGFQVRPHRRVVERTFGRFGGSRRRSEDDEYELESSEALIYAAMGRLMRRRIGRRTPPLSSPAG